MSHRNSILCRRNLRAYAAAFISYLMLAGQLAPLALGSAASRPLPAAATAPATVKAAPAAAALPFAAPIITATKVDAFPDPNGNGKAEPGDTITYTVEIRNTGDADATGVTFTDNVDPNTSLDVNSINTQPITDPDDYTASGNIPISLAAPGVLDNDRDPDPGDTLVVTEVQGSANNIGVATDTTATGRGGVKGSVTLNADGSFTYEPPPGFVGDDTFTYKAGDGTTTDAATTVTITISGMAWFIQAGAGGSNRGTFSNPFTTIAAFNTANAGTGAAPDPKTGDFIALRSGSYSEADGVNLRAQQKLIGNAVAFGTVFTADANSSSAYTTFAGAAGAAPTIAASAGNGVDLSTDNTVRGLNVANTSGFDINGAAVGSPVINTINLTGTGGALNVSTSGAFGANVTFNTLESTGSAGANLSLVGVTGTLGIADGGAGLSGSAAASPAVNVSGGSVTFTYPDNVSKTAGTGALVNVSGGHTGTLTFQTGTLNATAGTGLQFDNADGAYNFNGTTTLNGGDAGVDILSGSGGTFNFSASTSITSPTGTAFNVSTGAPLVTYSGTILDNTAGQRAVNIDGTTGGSIGINAVTTASVAGGVGNTGININNANGSVSFTTLTLGASATRHTAQPVTITGGSGTYSLGTVSIFTNGAQGVVATNADGTINITTGTVDTTAAAAGATAAAFNIDGPGGLTTLGISLTTLNVNNSTFGVSIVDTNGSFTVTDTATGSDRCGGAVTVNALGTPASFAAPVAAECTGGTISNITNAGVRATNATNVSFSRVNFTNANSADGGAAGGTCDLGNVSSCNGVIDLTNVTGATFSRINISGTTEEMGVVGSNVTGFSLTNSNVQNAGDEAAEHGVGFINLFGTVSITGTRVTGSAVNHLYVLNDGAVAGSNLNMTVTGNLLTGTSNIGTDGIGIDTRAGTTSFVNIANNTLTSNKDDHINVVSSNNAVMNVTISGNTMAGGHVAPTGQGVATRVGGPFSGTFRVDINGNHLNGAIPTAINVGLGSSEPAANMHAFVRNNIVGTSGVNNSGSAQGSCILVEANGLGSGGVHAAPAGTLTASVTNNTLRQCLDRGIDMLGVRDGDNNLNVTVSGNNVNELDEPLGVSRQAIRLETGSSLDDETGNVCADILNNTLNAQFDVEMSLRIRSIATMRFPGYTGGTTDTTAIQNYLQARNPAGGTAAASIDPPATFNNTVPAGSACPQPTAPTLPSMPEVFDSGANDAPGSVGVGVQAAAAPAAPVTVQPSAGNLTSRPFVTFPRGTSAPKPAAPAAKRAGGSTLRHTAEGVSAPLYTEPVAQRKKTSPRVAVLSDAPGGPSGAGGTVSVNIGTLRQGDSVVITFQVAVDNPYSGPLNVSNQGRVEGTNFNMVNGVPVPPAPAGNTEDTGASPNTGPTDPTLTPINAIRINVNDAEESEPASGDRKMLFVVSLSAPPAPASSVSVQYATTNGTATGGANCDGTADYVTASGTLNLGPGQQTGIIEVTVCADNTGGEPDETLTMTLSNPTGGSIQDGTATGTITQGLTPGRFIISELRTFGPGGSNDPNDEFVELYNNGPELTVAATDASAGYGVYAMGADCNAAPVLLGVIPNGTVIPERGHYLLTGSAYSLANYGGTGLATGNLTMAADIPSNGNVGVFSTGDVLNVSSANRLDAVGFTSNTGGVCSLLSEGPGLAPVATNLTALGQHTYFRTECGFVQGQNCTAGGNPKDSNDNAADFLFADPNGTNAGAGERNGAAGPQNMSSPIRRDTSGLSAPLLDGSVSSSAPPNRVRDMTNDPVNNSSFGTLSIRRRVQNNTGGNVTRLRFRIVEMTTFSSTDPGAADLRARTSPPSVTVLSINDPTTCAATGTPATAPCSAPVLGTTLEEPPTQPGGGGYNSTLAAGTITAATPLANGASINVQFLLGVQQPGRFRFFIIIEALP